MARRLLWKHPMRMFLTLLVAVACLGAVLKYREAQQPVIAATAQPSSEAAAPARHWPKNARDRATELQQQVAKERSERENE